MTVAINARPLHYANILLLRADAEDISAELYGVNHNGEVHRPVPIADALGLGRVPDVHRAEVGTIGVGISDALNDSHVALVP